MDAARRMGAVNASHLLWWIVLYLAVIVALLALSHVYGGSPHPADLFPGSD